MFDIGWSELLVIAVVAIVVVGPKDLPKLMRSIGHYAGILRRAAADFQRQFQEAMREAEVDEVRKAIESVRTETAALDTKVPMEKSFMPPTPEARPQVEAVAPGPAKPAAKRPRKRAAAKPKSSATRAKTGAENGP